METYLKNRRPPVEVAKDILKFHFPQAVCCFVAGSFQRGEATITSDIDLVVIFQKIDFAWRESFIFEGWPVEALVHDPETLNYFIHEIDKKEGIPSLPSMIHEGAVLPTKSKLSDELKAIAQKLLESPAPTWSEETISQQRYSITDLIEDLKAPRNKLEAAIIVGALHEVLGNFYFRSQNLWSSSRKHLPRKILKLDSQMGQRWVQCFEEAYQGRHELVIELVQDILKPYGGFLFEGHKRHAPKDWRLSINP